MPNPLVIVSLLCDLAGPSVHMPRVHGYALPFAVEEGEPHFLVEKEGWIVYIGMPVGSKDPIFRMARSRDRGAHWKVSDFEYDWYPQEVRVAAGRLDIRFTVVDCMGDSSERLEGALGGRLRLVSD